MRSIATWGGVCVTLSGIFYNVASGGDIVGAYISLVGVSITSLGHIISNAIVRHDREEKRQNEERIHAAEEFIHEICDFAEDAVYLRKIIKRQKDEDFIRGFNGDDWK